MSTFAPVISVDCSTRRFYITYQADLKRNVTETQALPAVGDANKPPLKGIPAHELKGNDDTRQIDEAVGPVAQER